VVRRSRTWATTLPVAYALEPNQTMFVGLIPIMWATGTGSDVWKRIAAPMVGGIFTSFVLELVVYPASYEIWKWHFEMTPGHEIARSTIAEILERHGIEPAPERSRKTTWQEFLRRRGTGSSGRRVTPGH
jgi:hypothetical protein